MAGRCERLVLLIVATLLFAGALAVRVSQIPERILHSDEAVQAYQVWRLMGEGVYEYSPEDRHGPVLYLLSAALLKSVSISGQELSGDHLRYISTFAGLILLAVFLIEGIRRSDPAWIIGGLFVGITPFVIIYQNFFIQESLFSLLSFLLLGAIAYSREQAHWSMALLVGALAALCLATKETALIHFSAIAFACILVIGPRATLHRWRPKMLLVAASTGVFIWIACMSLGFRRWDFVWEGVAAFAHYFQRAGGAGHEKPFGYYFSLLWPQYQAGVWWSQITLLIGAAAGALIAWVRKTRGESHQLWALIAVFSWSLWFVYSIIPYKTPWLVLTPISGFCLLSGLAIHSLYRMRPGIIGLCFAGTALTLSAAEPLLQWRPALFRYADDERNPYLYTHTLPAFSKLTLRLDELLAHSLHLSIAVIEQEHAWPLPWYLRNHERAGYFQDLPENPESFDVLIIDSRLLPDPLPNSLSDYATEIYGLRTNVLLYLFVGREIWNAYLTGVRQ